jgi:transposase
LLSVWYKINEKKVTEQELFIGLDVHDKQWTISVISKEKEYIRGMVISPNAKALKNLLDRKFSYTSIKLAYEAGFCGYWVQRSLTNEGIETIVVNAADIPPSDKDSKQKNDSRDSLKIAKALCGGLPEGIYIYQR